jgi:hypothetical protein
MRVTIKMFQQLFAISNMELDEIEKSKLLIQTFTNKTENELENISVKKYNKLSRYIKSAFDLYNKNMLNNTPKNIVKANGRWYFLNYDIARPPMNAGRYVEVATFSKDIIGNLHKIMSTMATPMKWTLFGLKPVEVKTYYDHERVANDMLHMDFKHAYHAAVFFWAVFAKSIENSQSYFQTIATDKTKVTEVLNDLRKHSDGFSQAKWYQNLKISV